MKKTIIAMLAFVFVSISGISYAADKVFALVPKAMNNPFFDLARDDVKLLKKKLVELNAYTLDLVNILNKNKFKSFKI